MKTLCMSLVLGVTVAVILNIMPCNLQVFARDGCCKERKTESGNWFPNGKTYSECKNANKQEGDKVFEEKGLVWWDKNC